MKTKRITALILAVVLIFGALPAMARYIDIENEALEMKVEILEQLGIISGFDDATFRPDAAVTRGELALFAARLFGLTAVDGEYFSDVNKDNDYAGYINALKKEGIVSGNDGLFHPDEQATGIDAAVILMTGLGYKDACEMTGAYPHGYLKMASRIDVDTGTAPLTREKTVKILYDTLTAEILEFSGLVGDEAKFAADGTLMIEEYYDMFLIEGIMTYNGYASTDGEYKEKFDFIVVDGVKINLEGKDAAEYLGYDVTVFAYYDDNDYYLRAISPTAGENEIITISSENIVNISDERVMRVEKEASYKTYPLAGSALIYNGEYLASYDKDILKPDEGYVQLIDNNGDSKYEVVVVYDLTDDVIKGINVPTETIYLEESNPIFYKDKELLVYIDGKKKSDSELAAGMTVSFAENDEFVTVWASTKKLSGVLTSSDEEYIFIADESLYRSKHLYIDGGVITSGKSYTAYVSSFGKVVRLTVDAGGEHYGWLVGIYWEDDFYSPSNVTVKLLSDTGAYAYLNITDKIRINGTSGKAELERFQSFGYMDIEKKCVQQLVKYSANEEGRMLSIAQPEDKTEDGISEEVFSLDKSVRNTETRIYRYNVGINYHLGAATKIFYLPLDSELEKAGESDYSVGSLNTFSTDAYYKNFDVYDTQPDRTIGVFAVRRSIAPAKPGDKLTEALSKRNLAVVVKNTFTYDGDDDVVTLNLMTMGKQSDIKASQWDLPNSTQDNWNYAKMTAKELKKGDIFIYSKNEKNEIDSYTMLFKGSELESMNFKETVPTGVDFDETNDVELTPLHTIFGEVVDINAATYSLNVTEKRNTPPEKKEMRHIVTTSSSKVYIMDYSEGEYRTGELSEIKPGDILFVRLYNYVPNEIVVFKGV